MNKFPIIKFAGRLDALSSQNFEAELEPWLENNKYIIIDLEECNYLSSTGIRILLKTHKKLVAIQGKVIITNLLPEVYQVLEMAGLHKILNLAHTPEVALEELELMTCNQLISFKIGDHEFRYQQICNRVGPLKRWKTLEMVGCNELGFSVGYGASAESENTDDLQFGLFATTSSCAGFIPDNKNVPPDFRVSPDPSNIAIMTRNAISFGQLPSGVLSVIGERMTMRDFISALGEAMLLIPNAKDKLMVLVNRNSDSPSISIVPGLTFKIERLRKADNISSISKFLSNNLTIGNIISVDSVSENEQLDDPFAWLFLPDRIEDLNTGRLNIEIKGAPALEPYQYFLIRKLYSDAANVIIEPLHGGYSAQTYQVTSYDRDGRKMRPTVLKTANRSMIDRESQRCQQYALPYIFNNSAAVLGTKFHGDRGALVYNFVGIGGESSRLIWLTHLYQRESVEALIPLFDKIFLKILKPWYGQAVKATIFPFRDHDPTLTFFPQIFQVASDLFSLSTDNKYIHFPNSSDKTINPYWFLKNEFSNRREHGVLYYESICHGDLNMQNILLDESLNVYLIDFSETKPRSAVSDFARLEAIFIGDNAPLESEEDMETYLEFVRSFYTSDSLNEIPTYIYRGAHREQVEKQALLCLRMRYYAFESVHREPDISLYYIALLEWMLPIVCYSSLSQKHKRLSMYICGLICEKIEDFK